MILPDSQRICFMISLDGMAMACYCVAWCGMLVILNLQSLKYQMRCVRVAEIKSVVHHTTLPLIGTLFIIF